MVEHPLVDQLAVGQSRQRARRQNRCAATLSAGQCRACAWIVRHGGFLSRFASLTISIINSYGYWKGKPDFCSGKTRSLPRSGNQTASGGFLLCHNVFCSKASAIFKSISSPNGLPSSCRPTGSFSSDPVKPLRDADSANAREACTVNRENVGQIHLQRVVGFFPDLERRRRRGRRDDGIHGFKRLEKIIADQSAGLFAHANNKRRNNHSLKT